MNRTNTGMRPVCTADSSVLRSVACPILFQVSVPVRAVRAARGAESVELPRLIYSAQDNTASALHPTAHIHAGCRVPYA